MLVDEARRIAAEIGERLNASGCQGTEATVKTDEVSPKSVPAGAGRPTFISYFIQITDDTRMAELTLGQAAGLIDDIEPGWNSDQLFDAIRAMDVPIEENHAGE
jgi:formate-dependent phosphoribosylglycinamide formyltransferase (GAR transformylase)